MAESLCLQDLWSMEQRFRTAGAMNRSVARRYDGPGDLFGARRQHDLHAA